MKLIVGLGNPGEKYTYTRHNLGFLFLDKFQKEHNFSDWKYEGKFLANISEGTINGEKTLLVKPLTFMNKSGEAIQKICYFYKLSSADFTVIFDDISMEFGKLRYRKTGSAGGHNGIKDIIHLFGNDFPRIKVGVGNNAHYDVSDWVLSKFSEEELIEIDSNVYAGVSDLLTNPLRPSDTSPLSRGRKKPLKKVYFVGIGGIGVSALARYYLSEGYKVYGSDKTESELIENLRKDGCKVVIGEAPEKIKKDFELCVSSEAVPKSQSEIQQALSLGVKTLRYNDALGAVVNQHKLIAITGTHGKSTTTSMTAQIFQKSNESFKAIVGTLLKEFDGKNFFSRGNTKDYFVIEACEYKEHFLAYKPTVAVITNIEYDHADFFKTPESYLSAYEKFIENIIPGGFCIIYGNDELSKTLIGKRKDIHYIISNENNFELIDTQGKKQSFDFPEIVLHVPGDHIMIDAKLAYIAGYLAGIPEHIILETLESYSGVWRRMEKIGYTQNDHLLMSDYGHHPTEISLTLEALKKSHPDTPLLTIFQPHQYSRTIELFDEFKDCFTHADILIIPDIYESRDSDEDKAKMNTQFFTSGINHPNILDGKGLENTLKMIEQYDEEYAGKDLLILLLGAGSVDNLRYEIETKKNI